MSVATEHVQHYMQQQQQLHQQHQAAAPTPADQQRLASPFACITRRAPVKGAWTETRHRVATAPGERPVNYLGPSLAALTSTTALLGSGGGGSGEPLRRHCATASLPVRRATSAKAARGGGGGGQAEATDGGGRGDGLPRTAPVAGSRTFRLGPGFQLTRSRDKVLVTLDSDLLFGERQKKADSVARQSRTVEETQRDALVAQMQRHLDSLVVMLEEERLRRREEVEALTAEMQDRLEEQARLHEGKIIDLLGQHQEAVQTLEKEKEEQAKESERKYSLMRQELEGQIGYLRTSFDAFKESYTKELEDKWRAKEADLVAQGEATARRLVDEATGQLLREREAEVEALQAGHDEALKKLRVQHENEVGELHARYSDMEGTVQRLNTATRELLAKDAKIKSLAEQAESKTREADTLARDLSATRSELAAFKARLDERVKQVDEKYKSRIATMRLEAVDLRKAYMAKCHQLVELRKTEDTRLAEKVYSSKEVMRDVIRARNRVKVSLAALDPTEDALEPLAYDRRFSQPTTGQERRLAAQSAGHADL